MRLKRIKSWRLLAIVAMLGTSAALMSSSHREAPLIADDPLADNTDVYAFRSPNAPDKICIIANYIPGQLPYGGPNYYHFGENIRYEVHIDNNLNTPGDDIVYRFTFHQTNQDPTTFFNIRLGKENLRTTYTMEKSTDGGATFNVVVVRGHVPPYYIGPRSIDSAVGLGLPSYESIARKNITQASTGERVFCGPVDDPFFVDLGGIFDLGDAPRQNGVASDGLACKNVSTIAIQIPISDLQKDHKSVGQAANILDPDFVIGVWASASRRSMRVLNGDGTETHSGKWVQVSRLGMPLTNEAVVPIGYKDLWNALTPYQDLAYLSTFGNFFYNPELALYMDSALFGPAVPAIFQSLQVQKNSLGAFGFGDGQNGLYSLKGTSAVEGTALDDDIFGTLLLPAANSPRSVDIWPVFHTGVPNLSPYQLATGKPLDGNGNVNPLAAGKPFINNFLPSGGDMLRLNMAVPITKRDDPNFSSLGLIQAAVLGLTDPNYNKDTSLQFIPNMDGFPNGRRLEDDVTRIELQAVGGVVLAAIGLPYDDYTGGSSVVTPNLLRSLGYTTGIERNDTAFAAAFPYEALPWSGVNPKCGCEGVSNGHDAPRKPAEADVNNAISGKEVSVPDFIVSAYPNPTKGNSSIKYHVAAPSNVVIGVYDAMGKQVAILVNKKQTAGTYTVEWNGAHAAQGIYFINAVVNGELKQSVKVTKQ